MPPGEDISWMTDQIPGEPVIGTASPGQGRRELGLRPLKKLTEVPSSWGLDGSSGETPGRDSTMWEARAG